MKYLACVLFAYTLLFNGCKSSDIKPGDRDTDNVITNSISGDKAAEVELEKHDTYKPWWILSSDK